MAKPVRKYRRANFDDKTWPRSVTLKARPAQSRRGGPGFLSQDTAGGRQLPPASATSDLHTPRYGASAADGVAVAAWWMAMSGAMRAAAVTQDDGSGWVLSQDFPAGGQSGHG